MQSHYSFGDSSRACERLGLLARVFDAPSRAFLTEAGLDAPPTFVAEAERADSGDQDAESPQIPKAARQVVN